MFQEPGEEGFQEVLDGIRMKTLVYGEKTLLAEFRLERGAVLPRHSHPHEQTGYLVSGQIDLTIGDDARRIGPGESWCIPGQVGHSAKALVDSVAIEVFSPVREDYLPESLIRPLRREG